MPQTPKQAVSAVIVKDDRVLLIYRSNPPLKHSWNLPGGKVNPGESCKQAIIREVFEETSLTFNAPIFLGETNLKSTDESGNELNYTIAVYKGSISDKQAKAGSDAERLEFVPISKLEDYDLPDETIKFINLAGCHPVKKHTMTGHLKTALIALFFGLAAYGFLFGLMKILKASGFQTF